MSDRFDSYIRKMNDKKESSERTGVENNGDKDIDLEIDEINSLLFKAEKQKYRFRTTIAVFISILLALQLVFFNCMVCYIIHGIIHKSDYFNVLSQEVTSALLEFLKYYISVTVVEMLGMVFFILRYAFSNRIYKKEKRQKSRIREDD